MKQMLQLLARFREAMRSALFRSQNYRTDRRHEKVRRLRAQRELHERIAGRKT